jgi:nucleotide-binding universal stress UspA family protein
MSAYHIQKIVVPIDLSETSLNALDTAVSIAKKHRATIQLLNVVENNFDCLQDDFSFSSSLINSADVLNALAGAVQHANDIKPEIIQLEGNVADSILKFTLTSQSDLVVMGTHGASGYRDGFIGSNTYCVLKHATCPVLIIPPKRKFLNFKKVLFPIRPVSGALMRYDVACHFLSASCSIEVLGLSYHKMETETNVLDKIIDEIKDQLVADRIKVSANWNKGMMIPEDVLQFSQQNNCDLIIITSVLDFTTKPGFIGPHSQKILHCSKVPVLNIKKMAVPSWV